MTTSPRLSLIRLLALAALVVGSITTLNALMAHPAGATAATCTQSDLPLPDPACTPGATNPDVAQSTINSTICVSGWTSTVRPPTSYTNPLKVQQIAEYGYTDTSTADYEEDHMIPLELGGAPRDPKNLWPEPRKADTGSTAATKDSVENNLKTMVCDGAAQLAAAQQAIATDWQTAISVVSGGGGGGGSGPGSGTVPTPDHTVVVMMENHSYGDIIGSSSAPYINSLAGQGAVFSQSFATTHPSEPNYLALFSGSTHSLTDDSCPHAYRTTNLGSELAAANLSFAGYSESMPSDGYTGCTSGEYARKHNPWVNFSNVAASANKTFTEFPRDYATLPAVSFVVPNLRDDMHDGTVAQGDSWLQQNIDGYAQWAVTHNSVLVLTWDEDDNSANNQIPTIIVGQPVVAGSYDETISHYSVLRTLEDAYGLPYAGSSSSATPITDIWQP